MTAAGLVSPARAQAPDPADPTTWTTRQLAAQLVVEGVQMSDLGRAQRWAKNGIGGIVLFGTPPKNLGHQLASVRAAGMVTPFVTSDEEGGEVQRLASIIYPLHSAQYMGHHFTPTQVKGIAHRYAKHMRALGVDVDLAPVADLEVPHFYMAKTHRAFAKAPHTVASYVTAWIDGMRTAHVATTAKHWPGHGHAPNSHTGVSTTPSFSYLKKHDLIPFRAAAKDRVPFIMVGDLVVPGLTDKDQPASISPAALKYLRNHIDDRTLIITDSLTMGGIQDAGYSTPHAAVLAIKYGADIALINNGDPTSTIDRLTHAISTGYLPRARAIDAVTRILAEKHRLSSTTNP
jgi:beta-N-acetylhexosaminidase